MNLQVIKKFNDSVSHVNLLSPPYSAGFYIHPTERALDHRLWANKTLHLKLLANQKSSVTYKPIKDFVRNGHQYMLISMFSSQKAAVYFNETIVLLVRFN